MSLSIVDSGVKSSVVGVMVSVGSVGWMAVGHSGVEDGGIGLGLSLTEGVSEDSAGADSQGAAVGVLLLEEGGGGHQAGDLVPGSLQVSVVSGNGLVSSDSHGDGQVGGSDLSLQGERLDHGQGVGVGSVGVGVGQQLRLGRSLAVVDSVGGDQGSSAGAEADVSAALLLVDGQGGHQAGHPWT